MSRLTIFLLGLLGAISIAMAAPPAGEKTKTLQWRMSLAADGKITALTSQGDAPKVLREKLEQVIGTWEFVPGQLDGQPAATETLLSVQVALIPSADGNDYGVRLDDVRTGGGIEKSAVPRFSANVVKQEMGSARSFIRQIIVEVSYDKNGQATSLAVAPSSPVQHGALLEATEKSLRKSVYAPERVGGVAVAGKLVVPICLAVSQGSDARRLAQACSWNLPGSKASVEQGQSLALESSVSLRSDVVDSLL